MKEEKSNTSRRDFLKRSGFVLGLSVTASTLPLFITSCEQDEDPIAAPPPSTVEVELVKYPDLANPGGAIKLLIKGKNNNLPLVIIRKDTESFTVYDSFCTHGMGGTVDLPKSGEDKMQCPLHNVVFSAIDGKVVTNPVGGWSPIPLKTYPATFDKAKNILKIEV